MQQRQLRLGDILDDYCPRERRVTNHAIVAMVGETVKQTRCTTCDAEHEYNHAKVPRQRRKNETPAALYAQVAAGAPKRVTHDAAIADGGQPEEVSPVAAPDSDAEPAPMQAAPEQVEANAASESHGEAPGDNLENDDNVENSDGANEDEGPIHRRLIRASLPRPEGQQPPGRPIPEFTIRQPAGRQNRFRPRHQRGGYGQQGQQFFGNRSNGNSGGHTRGQRPGGGGRPGMMNRRGGQGGRKRSK